MNSHNQPGDQVSHLLSDPDQHDVIGNNVINHQSDSASIIPTTNLTKVTNKLKCCLLNVCGLKSKLLSNDFEKFISEFEVIALTETKLSDLDLVDELFSDFTIINKNRKGAKKASGGIALLVHNHLVKQVQILNVSSDNDFVMWLRIDLFEKNLILAIVYLPPEGSRYSNIEMFDLLESSLLSLDFSNSLLCLVGDFNARTKNIDEMLYLDNHVLDISHDIVVNQLEMNEILQHYTVPVNRCSQDDTCNNYGKRLIELCRTFGLLIANGRCGKDKGVGSLTCDSASLIDYVICNTELIVKISDFEVLPYCNLLSDKHSPIYFAFNMDNCDLTKQITDVDIAQTDKQTYDVISWSNDKKEAFINFMDIDKVNLIVYKLDTITLQEHSEPLQIDSIVTDIGQLFHNSAILCKMVRKKSICRVRKRKSIVKPWFNDTCEQKRKHFFKEKNVFRSQPSVENKRNLSAASKEYKRQLRFEHKQYIKELNMKIKSLSVSDPKAYWKLLNKGTHRYNSSTDNTQSISEFFAHFQSLNDAPTIPENIEIEMKDISNSSEICELDTTITGEEIVYCIKHLKNNKSTGDDSILNEYIKASADIMINIYVKLFNSVLNSGIIPDSWVTGIILPLYKKRGQNQN